MTQLFIEGVSNRRDFIYVRVIWDARKSPPRSNTINRKFAGPRTHFARPCRVHVARRFLHGLEVVGNACLHVASFDAT